MGSSERERFEVILESLETKIGAIADGHLALNEKFDRLEHKVDGIDDRLIRVEDRLTGVETKVGRLENKVSRLETRVVRVDHKVDRVEKKVDRVASDMSVLRTDLGSVKGRVEKIEHHLGPDGAPKVLSTTPTARTPRRRKRT